MGKYVPPLTVASFAITTHGRPWIGPIPVTIPAPGAASSYIPSAASADSSRNEAPGSSRRSIRARAVSLPLASCLATASGPPPARARSRRCSSSATSVRIDAALVRKVSAPASTWLLRRGIAPPRRPSGGRRAATLPRRRRLGSLRRRVDNGQRQRVEQTTNGISIEELRAGVREFAEGTVVPLAAEIDERDAFPRQLWPGLGDLGVLGPTVATDDGGAGLGFLEHVVIMEELSRASASVGLSYAAHSNLCVHNLWSNGTAAQRARWLPKLVSGEHLGALAMSEPEAGSDVLGSMRCAARRTDGGWVANGSKMWITNGPEADVVVVYMRTDGQGDASPITAFVVERGAGGFRTAQHLDKLGMRGSGTCELLFEDCFIPDDQVLGAPGDGVRILMSGLDTERLVLSGGPIGIMQASLDLVLPYVRERRQFGVPIGSFELMQGKIADMFAALESSRAFAYRVAAAFDADPGTRRSAEAAACLLHASERAVEVSLEAIQALGGAGYLNESGAGRLLRDAKLYTIGAGTNEIRRMLIGRALIGPLE